MKVEVDLLAGLTPSRVVGSASQRAGLYYERAVARWFAERFLVAVQPRLRLGPKGRGRWRRPDLLVFNEMCYACVVVEVKNQFTEAAFKQVAEYREVVKLAFPFMRVAQLVVCSQLEKSDFMGTVRLVELPDQLFNLNVWGPNVAVLSRRELRLGLDYGLRLGGGSVAPPVRQSGSSGNLVRDSSLLSGVATKVGAG